MHPSHRVNLDMIQDPHQSYQSLSHLGIDYFQIAMHDESHDTDYQLN